MKSYFDKDVMQLYKTSHFRIKTFRISSLEERGLIGNITKKPDDLLLFITSKSLLAVNPT